MTSTDRIATTHPSTRPARRRRKGAVALLASALLLVACSSDPPDTASTTTTNPPPPSPDLDDADLDNDDDTAGQADHADADADDQAQTRPSTDHSDSDIVPALYDDRILAADIWDDELRILSAGMGFDSTHPGLRTAE